MVHLRHFWVIVITTKKPFSPPSRVFCLVVKFIERVNLVPGT